MGPRRLRSGKVYRYQLWLLVATIGLYWFILSWFIMQFIMIIIHNLKMFRPLLGDLTSLTQVFGWLVCLCSCSMLMYIMTCCIVVSITQTKRLNALRCDLGSHQQWQKTLVDGVWNVSATPDYTRYANSLENIFGIIDLMWWISECSIHFKAQKSERPENCYNTRTK